MAQQRASIERIGVWKRQFTRALTWGTLTFALMTSNNALARPVTEKLDLDVGGERFLKVDSAPIAQVVPEGLISFEVLPPNEAFVVAQKPGRGTLFVMDGASNVFRALTVRVKDKGDSFETKAPSTEALDRAQAACASLVLQATVRGQEMEAEVSTPECRLAILELLKSDAFVARNVAFNFTVDVMREQLKAIEARLQGQPFMERIQLYYVNVTLVIRGKLTLEERMEVLKAAWEETVGNLIFEDRTERLPSEAKGHAKKDASTARQADEPPSIQVESIDELKKSHPELFDGKTSKRQWQNAPSGNVATPKIKKAAGTGQKPST